MVTIAPAPPLAERTADLGEPAGALGTLAIPARGSAPVAASPAVASPSEDAALTLSVLAALLASPHEPHPAGRPAAAVRATLAGPLGSLLTGSDQGWRLATGTTRTMRAPQPDPSTEPGGTVPAAVMAALLAAARDGDPERGGWKLPERG